MLRDSLLKEFEQHPSAPLSGQYLADKYQVSRNAIWKAIGALKTAGYPIVTIGRKGYCLQEHTDLLTADGIRAWLQKEWKDLEIDVHQTLDSTNSEALRRIAAGKNGHALITTERQTNGRGHAGSTFYSPTALGLYMTLVLPVSLEFPMLPVVGKGAAVAVCSALGKRFGHPFSIDGINDIYDDDRKVCGILSQALTTDLESGTIQTICIGIGIYLHRDTNASGPQISFSALDDASGRCRLAAEITNELLQMDFTNAAPLLKAYSEAHRS